MPPKRKEFLKPNANTRAKPSGPQTENDFLEAADEFEQSAGKWRAGDIAKATRFFNRAIDMYNAGLQKYPNSFDLAYNKANLEYNMIEDPRVVSILGDKISLLEETLSSHRTAIALNSDNTDILFNTAQVLTSLAEALLEKGTQETAKVPSRALLEEAVEIFTKCLASQQREYEEMQVEIAKAHAAQRLSEVEKGLEAGQNATTQVLQQDRMETSSTISDERGDWATIIEPVTPETILETCTAQLEALSTLLCLYDPSDRHSLKRKVQMGLETAEGKIPALANLLQDSSTDLSEEPALGPTLSIAPSGVVEVPKTSPRDDAFLAAANFKVSVAEVAYRHGDSSAVEYGKQIEQIFASLDYTDNPDDLASVNVRCAFADALINLASAVSENAQYTASSPNFITDLESQWSALSQAQAILTHISSGVYSTRLSASRLADIFLARGDTDLFRFRISLFYVAKSAWVKSKAVLVSNAGVFYRGARSYAKRAGAVDVQRTADAKATVAEILKAAASGLEERKEHWKSETAEVVRVLEQMVEEGIVGREDAKGLTCRARGMLAMFFELAPQISEIVRSSPSGHHAAVQKVVSYPTEKPAKETHI
ncbi:hypothetical protein CC78DRAFT_549183 [Lojkania enalia]|uniref:Uncharacterized protein n=1 Tax=Lojkania enalia TaxID=147567 RepID=A0A9P4JYW1_9PLEO|nr:hypothetical protein CC78DRAFT_549183 [Didymosphaeria enalia]